MQIETRVGVFIDPNGKNVGDSRPLQLVSAVKSNFSVCALDVLMIECVSDRRCSPAITEIVASKDVSELPFVSTSPCQIRTRDPLRNKRTLSNSAPAPVVGIRWRLLHIYFYFHPASRTACAPSRGHPLE